MADLPLRWYHRLYVGMQHLLPQHLLAGLMYRATRLRAGPVTAFAVRRFVQHFRVDLDEVPPPAGGAWEHFNAFFTRPLRPGARPIPEPADALACPCDGTVSQLGMITGGRVFQAKGHDFSLPALLGGDAARAAAFEGGSFATIYLSPRDYHRVHMPLGGELTEMVHVPGRLFSVNPVTTRLVPGLFARNERVLCLFRGEAGPMAVILVGAIFVGGIETVWAGEITPRGQTLAPVRYGRGEVRLEKGAEMGRFNMGSTVILLFPPGTIAWDPALGPGTKVRMGERIGTVL